MSRTLLIAPHADDETLFASYLAQRYAATIAVVYDEGREHELSMATAWLGCPYVQLRARKGMGEEETETYLNGLRDPAGQEDWERIIAPAEEIAGHEEHNIVARVCGWVFKDVPITRYTTYAPRGHRTKGPHEVVPEPQQIGRKLAALSCYRSQIDAPNTRAWFYYLLDMREWTA